MAEVTLDTVHSMLLTLSKEVKTLSKLVRKVRNTQEDPTGEKAKLRAANNGFNRELNVSAHLQSFLGLEEGAQISRSNVTRQINKYINENNLKHPDNGRLIILDDKLKSLLSPEDGVQVSFLNIQKYLSKHYVKKDVEETPAATVVVEDTPKKEPKKRPTVKKSKA